MDNSLVKYACFLANGFFVGILYIFKKWICAVNKCIHRERRREEEEERRRKDAIRRQRDEEDRLRREREELRKERERLEQEKQELMKFERERQRLEREKLEREKQELERLRRQQLSSRAIVDDRRSSKRMAEDRDPYYEDRKRAVPRADYPPVGSVSSRGMFNTLKYPGNFLASPQKSIYLLNS